MSLWCAWVGEIVIKPEFREDFGYLFRGEYDRLESGSIADYVKLYKDRMLPLCYWKHDDEEVEWKGKYKTSYDEETGFFTYGVSFNQHGEFLSSMLDMADLLEEITEEEISNGGWYEDWLDEDWYKNS